MTGVARQIHDATQQMQKDSFMRGRSRLYVIDGLR